MDAMRFVLTLLYQHQRGGSNGSEEQVEKMGGELRRGHALLGGSGSMLSKVGAPLPLLLPL